MDDDTAGSREAARRLQVARDRWRELQYDVARVAGEIADAEDRASELLQDAAAAHLDRADHLEAMAAGARAFAAKERAAGRKR